MKYQDTIPVTTRWWQDCGAYGCKNSCGHNFFRYAYGNGTEMTDAIVCAGDHLIVVHNEPGSFLKLHFLVGSNKCSELRSSVRAPVRQRYLVICLF